MKTVSHDKTSIITAVRGAKGKIPLTLARNGINMTIQGVSVLGSAITIIIDGRQFVPLQDSDVIQDPNN